MDGDIAIVDTGVNDHPDLNVYRSVDCVGGSGCSTTRPANDGYGHGTAVAGVAAALDNGRGVVGTAPGARIWNVRVFDKGGFTKYSWITSALWIG